MSKAVGEQFNFQRRSGRYTLYGFANGRVDVLPANAKDHDYRSEEQKAADDADALRAFEERNKAPAMTLLERVDLLRCQTCGGVKPIEWHVSGGSNGEFKGFQPCTCPELRELRSTLRRLRRGGTFQYYIQTAGKIGVDV